MDTETEESSLEEEEEKASVEFLQRELIQEEFELEDRSDTEISHWWKTLILLSYFVTGISGLATSIAIGDLLDAFKNQCILYAKISLINMENFDFNRKLLAEQNVSEDKWGNLYDCEFCEFASLFSVVFAGMLFAMFAQCGRGGITSKGQRRSWEFVPLALIITIIFFIIGTVIFAKTIGGFSFFCNYILRDSHSPGNISTCHQILSYHFPWNTRTDLYTEYVLAHVGASLTFAGWFASLVILIFRCLLGIDFVLYRKRSYSLVRKVGAPSALKMSKGGKHSKHKKVRFLQNSISSSSDDSDFQQETTSFIAFDVDVETKKLI